MKKRSIQYKEVVLGSLLQVPAKIHVFAVILQLLLLVGLKQQDQTQRPLDLQLAWEFKAAQERQGRWEHVPCFKPW